MKLKSHSYIGVRTDERPPGAFLHCPLGLTVAESFRDRKTVTATDHVTFCSLSTIYSVSSGRFRGFGFVGSYAVNRGVPTDTGNGNGTDHRNVSLLPRMVLSPRYRLYVPADDLTDPAPATTFTHLDATTVLSRKITELGIYPAVDPLESTSRILDPLIVGQEHYDVAQRVKQILQRNKGVARYHFSILGMDELSDEDRQTVNRARRVKRSFTTFAVAEQFTGVPGVMVSIEDTIKGFKMILDGEVDYLPEQAF